MSTQNTTQLTITRPDDWHLHLRDGAALEAVVADTARQFARAIIMPNLKPPVTTTEQALAYRGRILAALAKAGGKVDAFTPLMTLYLTDNTSAEEIFRAHESGGLCGQAVSGRRHDQLRRWRDRPAGQVRQGPGSAGKCGMPLLVHGEVTDPSIDVFDREAIFVERVMKPLRRAFPALKVVFEHITTKEGAEYVRDAEGPIAATITPQHMLYNRNAIFQGGVRPHWYCLPILKRETHRLALVEAATSGSPRFFLGTDSAPHARGLKEHACGCAGCYTALHAMELYATAFDAVGKLDKLEGFASFHGPDFYGLPRNTGTLTLVRESFQIPEELPFGNTALVPLAAGETLTARGHLIAPAAALYI